MYGWLLKRINGPDGKTKRWCWEEPDLLSCASFSVWLLAFALWWCFLAWFCTCSTERMKQLSFKGHLH